MQAILRRNCSLRHCDVKRTLFTHQLAGTLVPISTTICISLFLEAGITNVSIRVNFIVCPSGGRKVRRYSECVGMGLHTSSLNVFSDYMACLFMTAIIPINLFSHGGAIRLESEKENVRGLIASREETEGRNDS